MSKLTATRRTKFLDKLRAGLSVSAAASAIRVSRQAAYKLRDHDEVFATDWDDAIETGTDRLEDEVIRRAQKGTNKPVFYKGKRCGHVREYSDTLAIFTLKARRPDKFKDRALVEHDVTDNLAQRLEAMRKRRAGK